MASTANRGYTYPDEYSDDWFNTFVAMLNAIDVDMAAVLGGTVTSNFTMRKASPSIRLIDTSAGDFRVTIDSGNLVVQKNTGTEAVPVWSTLLTLKSGGDIQLHTAGKGLILRDTSNTADYRIAVEKGDNGNSVITADPA